MPSIIRNVHIDNDGNILRVMGVNGLASDNDLALMRETLLGPSGGFYNNSLQGEFKADKVWNSVWNDYADLQLLCDDLIPGKCYIDTYDGAKLCTERCQLSVIGIASDTFAHAVGTRSDQKQVPIAVAGWVLAHVDREYPCGTPLTNDEFGNLTEMTLEEKRNYPERLIGIYKRKEVELEFGTEGKKVKVNNRHWVKVK